MKFEWKREWPHLLLIALMFGLALATWAGTPDRVPVHWNLKGEIDRHGSRAEGLLAIPLVACGVYVLMLFLPRFDPGRANYASFAPAYASVRLLVLAMLAAVYGVVVLQIQGHEMRVGTVIPMLAGAMFIVLGNIMGKLRPNWFVGVRTPWTLSSKRSWTRTHRAAGWVFVAIGVLTLASASLRPEWSLWAMGIALLLGSVGLVIYSYREWRNDPEKVPPTGTLPM